MNHLRRQSHPPASAVRKTRRRIFDHVDLRVANLSVCTSFYEALLPKLGFTLRVAIDGWLQFEADGDGDDATEFFGITEDPKHIPNRSRIAFWAESQAQVDELSTALLAIGAQKIEGPGFESDNYYAVYFDDPSGNPLEICYRSRKFTASSTSQR